MAQERKVKRVLIVDDELPVTFLLAENLKKLGNEYLVETANDGEQALTKIRESRFDLILTDYRMPGMDGLKLAQTVRRLSPHTQVILMTAFGTNELRGLAGHRELDGYIDKPFTSNQIREVVRRAVEQTHQADAYRAGTRTLQDEVGRHLEALRLDSGARCVLLLSASGYPVETVGVTEGLDVNSLGALIAANFAAATELARLLGSNSSIFKSSYHEGPDYNIYAYDVDGELLLAVIFGSESKPGAVWFYTKQAASVLKPLVEAQATDLDLDDDFAADLNAGLDGLFDGAALSPVEVSAEQLMDLEDAIASGLLPAELWDRDRDAED